MKGRIFQVWFLLMLVLCLAACSTSESGSSKQPEEVPPQSDHNEPTGPADSDTSKESEGQLLLDEFFITIGTDVSRADIDDIAKSMGLYISHKNSGTGKYIYRVAVDKDVANVNYPEKGSYVTVSFNTLKDDAITEISYFDESRMIAGYWEPDTGYRITDYNYPQIVYYNEDVDKVYSSQIPVNSAKEIVEYSFDGDPGENLLEVFFLSLTSSTTKDDLMVFVNEYGLNYNSRGVGNAEIVSYCYNVGEKHGEDGSYLTFSTNSDGIITQMTYYYYPASYRNGYSANFYSESYALTHSVPSGFVLKTKDSSTEYSSADELLAQLHN